MLTLQQALTANEFHYGECTRTIGSRGGVTIRQEVWRRNGQTQTWKTRPNEYRIPVKYGMHTYGQLRNGSEDMWHAASDCPLHAPYVTPGRAPFGTGRD